MMHYDNKLASKSTKYTWRQLAQRAGVANGSTEMGFESLDIPIFYGRPEEFYANKSGVIVVPTSSESWRKLLDYSPRSLHWLPSKQVMPPKTPLPVDKSIPVLFWGKGYEDGNKPFAERLSNGSIVFYADIIAATLFMLSRWEETVVETHDEHGRFPASASVAYKQGFLDRPIIDEYALILRAWLKVLLPRWSPTPRQFSIKLSHDIDSIRRFDTIRQGFRATGHYLLKRHNLKWATDALVDMVACSIFPHQNSDLRGIYHLAKLSHQYQLDSAFYFKASPPGVFDSGYNPADTLLKPIIEQLQNWGFEIGFHPGYDTLNNLEQFLQEKNCLEKTLSISFKGGRQHYLRFNVPKTWRFWETAGLDYDSTLGYADHEGFRCGTCHPFHPFDIIQDRELNLWEYPLIVMDGTLKSYRKLTPEKGKVRILALAQRCQQVEGVFSLLWHNSSLVGEWETWMEMYTQITKTLSYKFI